MSVQAVLLPLFVQVALTLVVGFWAARARYAAVKGGEVRPRDVALREPAWPTHATQIANAYQNQLELPLLFYLLTVLALITRQADLLFVVMAWLFVALRLVHVWIHVTDNHMRRRFIAFAAGAVVLTLMWLIFAIRILPGT